jgi:hypothetical protein
VNEERNVEGEGIRDRRETRWRGRRAGEGERESAPFFFDRSKEIKGNER